jgi:hypothetical protein
MHTYVCTVRGSNLDLLRFWTCLRQIGNKNLLYIHNITPVSLRDRQITSFHVPYTHLSFLQNLLINSNSYAPLETYVRNIPFTLYPRRGSRGVSNIPPRHPRFQKYLAMSNIGDVIGGKPIAGWSESISGENADIPLVAFSTSMEERERCYSLILSRRQRHIPI